MLIGRESERRVIETLVAGARVGESGVLVLTGEAGIGKTTLLQEAAALAEGMRLLRATGSEPEREVPFGGLLQLLRPALDHLDLIPRPQADALGTALALRSGGGGDRFAVGAATLSLLSRFAEDGPVALIIDDAHLLDLPSAEAVTFAARRLTADPIVLIAAARDDEPCALTAGGLPEVPVRGIDLAAAGVLVGRHHHGPVPPGTVARLHRATGGNPLALVELADDVDGLGLVPDEGPVPVPASLARAFSLRSARLGPAARTALLVAAVSGGDLAVTVRASALLAVDAAALDEACSAGLVQVTDDRVEFRHPLVRSVVYRDAPAADLRLAHRAVAASLPEVDADRRAWHLAEAALGPDEAAASALDDLAGRARDRRAYAVAATASERAARLTPEGPLRSRRFLAAAESTVVAGQARRARMLVDEGIRSGDDAPASRTMAQALRASIAARYGSLEEARDLLVTAADEAAAADGDAAVVLLADAVSSCFYLGDARSALVAADRITSLLPATTTDRARILGLMAVGVAHTLGGRGGAPEIRAAVDLLAASGELGDDPSRTAWLLIGPLFLRESATGRELVQRAVEGLRDEAAVGTLPELLFHVARDDATTDRWAGAEAGYSEGIRLARETGQTTHLAGSLAGLAWLEARQGSEAGCRAHAEEAMAICRARSIHLFGAWTLFALSELELALGRPQAALTHLQELVSRLDEMGVIDVDLSPGPELVEALLRLGREPEARLVAEGYAQAAAAKGQPWAMARAGRAAGLVAGQDDLDQCFGSALALHLRTPDAFEEARTRLAYGARLRRARRRVDARPVLRAAVAAFDRLGAGPWADLAAVELKATGETAQRRGSSATQDLTPQELQISTLLAQGRTTRQVAAALFLSPKTVEYHLRHVYTKLGVRSRDALARALADRSR